MKNDNRILELTKKIEEKKFVLLGKSLRFNPVTTCIFKFPRETNAVNINTLNLNDLKSFLIEINALCCSAIDLDLEDILFSGFVLKDWFDDIKQKIEVLNHKEEQTKLNKMETTLKKLLSEEKKVEMEIDDIENLLK